MKRAILFVLAIAAASCGDLTRQGTASSYLIVNSLQGAPGASPTDFGGNLASDVETSGTIHADNGQVSFTLGLKDAGPSSNPNEPTANNSITVNRYRVRYVRADGRNTPGVDVPYGFDGAFTVTVNSGGGQAVFTLVRAQAKAESPLAALRVSPVVISTIAQVTFYGRDQTGREVEVTANIGIDFANWGD